MDLERKGLLEEDIENVHKFSAFCNPLALNSLWNGHFFELADNGLSGCMLVVVVNARKWGHFGVAWCVRTGPDWLVGAVQKLLTIWCSHNKYMVCHKDCKKCAYQYIIKGFSLTGK